MNIYKIKIDGLYLVDTSTETIGKTPAGGWYDTGGEISGLILSRDEKMAKRIERTFNLRSYFNRIYDAVRFTGFQFNRLEILRVDEE